MSAARGAGSRERSLNGLTRCLHVVVVYNGELELRWVGVVLPCCNRHDGLLSTAQAGSAGDVSTLV